MISILYNFPRSKNFPTLSEADNFIVFKISLSLVKPLKFLSQVWIKLKVKVFDSVNNFDLVFFKLVIS